MPIHVVPTSPRHGDSVAVVENVKKERPVQKFLRAKLDYARERACQALPDHRALPTTTLIRSARWLAERLNAEGDAALSAMLALTIGLPFQFFESIALATEFPNRDDLEIWIDIENGIILFDLNVLAPHRARPSTECSPNALHQTNGILAKPLPEMLANALRVRQQLHPTANNLFDLLSCRLPIILPGAEDPIATTLPRLLNTLAPCAVELGIDRYTAALITLDPRIIPSGRFYYSSISRHEIWTASGRLFANLGWGVPASFSAGLDIGSAICPTNETVKNWFRWISARVESCSPGRRYTLQGLVAHHTEYTLAAASIACLMVSARASHSIRISTSDIGQNYISFFDKRTGEHPGAHALPVMPLLTTQLSLYARHCRSLHARLLKLNIPTNTSVIRQLRNIDSRINAPLFFEFDSNGRTFTLGSGQLAEWWPQAFGLATNWPRHFWQRTLRESQVPSTPINFFVRHQISGEDAQSSVAPCCARTIAAQLLPAISAALETLGIVPIEGLGKRDSQNATQPDNS